MSKQLDSILEAISAYRYTYADEDALQGGLSDALTAAGIAHEREVRLNARDRIDILAGAGAVGIEVKVEGQSSSVVRQLRRYAKHESVEEILLVTNRYRHEDPDNVPREIDGKPVTVLNIARVA